jgi:hypothetical protein
LRTPTKPLGILSENVQDYTGIHQDH